MVYSDALLYADFGLAMRGTTTEFAGTWRTMAPEVVRCLQNNAPAYGSKVDMWAVGVTICELISGWNPLLGAVRDHGVSRRQVFHQQALVTVY